MGLGLSSGQGSLVTIFGRVTNSTTKHTQVIVEAVLTFLRGKLSIFAELVGDRGRVTRGRCGLAGLTRLVLVVVFVVFVRVVVSRGRVFVFVVGLVVLAIRFVGTIGFVSAGTGFLAETFPVAGVDGVSKFLHSFEGRRFTLLTHSILNSLCKTGIIAVAENTVIPASAEGKAVEFNIILDNVLVVLHFEIVDPVFGIGGGINGAELDAEISDEGGPIIHPFGDFIRIKDCPLEVL